MPSGSRVYWLTEEFPPQVGGTGLVAAAISKGLAARGLAVQVITRQTEPPCPHSECIDQVRVRRISPAGLMKGVGWRALPTMVAYLARLSVLLLREARHYDVIVISCMKIIPLAAIPAARLLGKRCIVRLESPAELLQPIANESLAAMNRSIGTLLMGLLQRMQRRLLARADCVIAISQDVERLLLALPRPPARIARIPNAINMRKFVPVSADARQRLRRELHLPDDRVLAVYAGRLSRAKGIVMLVEEWAKVLDAHRELLLLIIGSGQGSWDDCEDQLVELVRSHQLQDSVILLGQSARVAEYLQCADFFISPSDYEGFGLAVAEALACGLPIVSTSVGTASELIIDGINGFLFPPKNRDAMTGAIYACLERRADWPDIGRRARASVAPFDECQIFDRYATLCRDLAG